MTFMHPSKVQLIVVRRTELLPRQWGVDGEPTMRSSSQVHEYTSTTDPLTTPVRLREWT